MERREIIKEIFSKDFYIQNIGPLSGSFKYFEVSFNNEYYFVLLKNRRFINLVDKITPLHSNLIIVEGSDNMIYIINVDLDEFIFDKQVDDWWVDHYQNEELKDKKFFKMNNNINKYIKLIIDDKQKILLSNGNLYNTNEVIKNDS